MTKAPSQFPPPAPRRRPLRRILSVIGILAVLLLVTAIILLDVFRVGSPRLPSLTQADEAVHLPQNWPDGWKPGQREWFHHASQGTVIMPYAWFINLERPEIGILRPPGLFVDSEYLARFGFLPSTLDPRLNPEGRLPIGFAIAYELDDPVDGRVYDAVGLTCAACHTGRLTFTDSRGLRRDVLIDGGSSMIHLRLFQETLGRAVAYTLRVPFRFDRFADRVVGGNPAARQKLRQEMEKWFSDAMAGKELDDKRNISRVASGFARTDALALIGNRVFGPIATKNLIVADAPVNFPFLWDISWFDWVQYNASIRMVMVRNIGEALGVGARTNVDARSPRFLESSVDVENLHLLEDQLGGAQPFQGLRPPKWNDAVERAGFPPLDPQLVERGRSLYGRFCAQCHLASYDELETDRNSPSPAHWTAPGPAPNYDKRFLKLEEIALDRIGTDPAQAVHFAFRSAGIPNPLDPDGGGITLTGVKGLRLLTEQIRETAFKRAGLNEVQRAQWDRFRQHTVGTPDWQVIDAKLKYKARPLAGIWATPPFLHNGSVPNLDQVLLPVAQRSAEFTLGHSEFDAVRVGYTLDPRQDPELFNFDTSLPGNHNTGHEFRDLSLVELEVMSRTLQLGAPTDVNVRWAKVFGVPPADYMRMTPAARALRVRDLTIDAIKPNSGWIFYGVIGPSLDDDERHALIEYLKSL